MTQYLQALLKCCGQATHLFECVEKPRFVSIAVLLFRMRGMDKWLPQRFAALKEEQSDVS